MGAYRIIFVLVVVTLISSPVVFDRGLAGTILRVIESQAATDTTLVARSTNGKHAEEAEMKDGSFGSRLTAQEVKQLLKAHNEARADVGVGPLAWSERLAFYAQEWVDHLASTSHRMEHRPHSGKWKQEHGENLFMGTAGHYGVVDAVVMWEKEKSAYSGETINCSRLYAYGHYTQLVWKNTRQIGCAKVVCGGNVIIVCNYDPPGNVLGQKAY